MTINEFRKTFLKASIISTTILPAFSHGEQHSFDAIEIVPKKDAFVNFLGYVPRESGWANEQQPLQEMAPPPKERTIKPTPIELNSRLQIGGNYTWVSLNPHGHQTFDGNLWGAQALYEFRPLNRFYGGVKFAYRQGDTHSPAGERSLLYFDVHERLGYTFASNNTKWQLTLFSGFGYRYTGQKFNPKKGNSLHFNYNEFYFPLGILTQCDVTSWFAIGADFIWMPQIYPTVTISRLKGARWITTCTLANYYVEVPFTFTLTENKRWQLIFKPFYEHWQNGHTTAKLPSGTSLGLPGNTYNFYGIDANFAYSF